MNYRSKILLLEITLSIVFSVHLTTLFPEGVSSAKWWLGIIVFNIVMQLYKRIIKSEK